jgi:hypothetical protein
MALTATLTGRDVWGSKCMTYGAWTGTGTALTINTHLRICEQLLLQPTSTTSPTVQCNVTTTLPAAGSAIVTAVDTDVTGYWLAIGDAFD